jgi:hypothetical protein
VFNWRTPALYVALGAMPPSAPLLLLIGLGVVMLASLMMYLARRSTPEGTVLGLVTAAAAVVTLAAPACWPLSESWSGLLIGISTVAYASAAWVPAASLGVSALFVRELAAPYCVIAVLLAARARRKKELAVWLIGLSLFGLYYGAHVSQVRLHQQAADLAHPQSWVQWGGLPFWLVTLKANGAFLVAPRPLLAALSVLLVSSVWASSTPQHIRGTVIAYGLLFAVVGHSFNDYWGFVPVFAYAFAMAYGPSGVRTLIVRATHRSMIDVEHRQERAAARWTP